MSEEQAGVGEETTAVDGDGAATELDDKAKLREAIDVDVEDVGTLRKKMTITIPRDAIDERLGDQFSELKRDAMVPGFRKGHAPLKLVEKRFGQDVGDQLITQLVSSGYLAAVEKVDISPLGDPLIWVGESGVGDGERLIPLERALAEMSLPSAGPLTFACEVELRPEFELPSLDDIPVEKPKIEIDDSDVQAEIDRFRALRGQFAPVDDSVQVDDLIVADVAVTIDGKTVLEEKNTTAAARPQILAGIRVEQMGEELKGKNVGDVVTFEAPVGDDHENMDYRGKTASFTITVHDIKRMTLPEVDADFLESAGFDSEEEMRAQIRSALDARMGAIIQRGMRGQIGKYLLERTDLEVPEGLSQRQTERLVAKRMVEQYQQGVPEEEIRKNVDELRARASEDTLSELKLFFIMEKIAEEMDLDVLDDELNGAIASIAAQQNKRFDRVRDELSKGQGLTALYLQLRDDKILDALLAKAVITETEGSAKKTADKKPKAKKAAPKPAAKAEGEESTEVGESKGPKKAAEPTASAKKTAPKAGMGAKKTPSGAGKTKKTTKKKADG